MLSVSGWGPGHSHEFKSPKFYTLTLVKEISKNAVTLLHVIVLFGLFDHGRQRLVNLPSSIVLPIGCPSIVVTPASWAKNSFFCRV